MFVPENLDENPDGFELYERLFRTEGAHRVTFTAYGPYRSDKWSREQQRWIPEGIYQEPPDRY